MTRRNLDDETLLLHHETNDEFPFVHPSIAARLRIDPSLNKSTDDNDNDDDDDHSLVDPSTLRIRLPSSSSSLSSSMDQSDTVVDMEMLQRIAVACDRAIYGQTLSVLSLSSTLTSLVMAHQHSLEDDHEDDNDDDDDHKTEVFVSTLVALNLLESAIRNSLGYTTGKAPLLKTMLQRMTNKVDANAAASTMTTTRPAVVPVLEALLLPNGLNLRNLLRHGFVSRLERPWLSLILTLIHNVQPSNDNVRNETPQIATFPFSVDAFEDLLSGNEKSNELTSEIDTSTIRSWIPTSHHRLLDWCLKSYPCQSQQVQEQQEQLDEQPGRPVTTIAVLCLLLEHALRLHWCKANHRPQDRIASPAQYYVTLDGHGQRHKHNLLLSPHVHDGNDHDNDAGTIETQSHRPNQLVERVGGSTVALLTDLFASSCGGPNIRAAVAHGLLDSYLQQEVLRYCGNDAATNTRQGEPPPRSTIGTSDSAVLGTTVRILWVTMQACADRAEPPIGLRSYCPQFSYTATTIRVTEQADDAIQQLQTLVCSPRLASLASRSVGTVDFGLLHIHTDDSQQCHQPFWQTNPVLFSSNANKEWTADSVRQEHRTNVCFAPMLATRQLLQDVAIAARECQELLESLLHSNDNDDDNTSTTSGSRQLKRVVRLCGLAQLSVDLYRFAWTVAMMSIQLQLPQKDEDDDDEQQQLLPDKNIVQQAVRRCIMTVSTYSQFLPTNSDRAVKAVETFQKGKAVKIIAAYLQRDERTNERQK